MRVIRNIVRNTTVDSVSVLRGALYLVDELAAGCLDIYSYNYFPYKITSRAYAKGQKSKQLLQL